MKILFCNFEYPPLGGGGGVVNSHLAEELAKKHEVTVLTSRGLGLSEKTVKNGVEIIRAPVFFRTDYATANLASMLMYVPAAIPKGHALLKRSRFDIINTHFVVPSGPVGTVLSYFHDIPHVISVHGGDLYEPSKWLSPHRHALLRLPIKLMLESADCVIGQSTDTISNIARFYTNHIECLKIPLGIKKPKFARVRREDLGFDDDDIILVSLGRLVKRKATEQLIKMLSQIDNTKVKLLIIGRGPEEPYLRSLKQKLGLQNRVRFAGFVEEELKFGFLSNCDIFVSSSQHEGFGLVFLEAMACGLPIVAYDYGGQTDLLEDGITGHVVQLNQTSMLATRCRDLIDKPAYRARISSKNKERASGFFIDQTASRYEDAFNEVLAEQSAPSQAKTHLPDATKAQRHETAHQQLRKTKFWRNS